MTISLMLPEGETQPGRALRGVPSDEEQQVVRRAADSAPPHKGGTQCNASGDIFINPPFPLFFKILFFGVFFLVISKGKI